MSNYKYKIADLQNGKPLPEDVNACVMNVVKKNLSGTEKLIEKINLWQKTKRFGTIQFVDATTGVMSEFQFRMGICHIYKIARRDPETPNIVEVLTVLNDTVNFSKRREENQNVQ